MKKVVQIILVSWIGHMNSQSIPFSVIKQSIQKGNAFLIKEQSADGSFSDSTNGLFNTWETVLVSKALMQTFGPKDTLIQKSLSWLKSQENSDGLICHNIRCKGGVCLETSSLYLQLLHDTGDTIGTLLRFKSLCSGQLDNGSWDILNPYVKGDKNYVSVPAFILNTAFYTQTSVPDQDKALDFIQYNFSENGFPSNWEYYGTPTYAIWQGLRASKQRSDLYKALKYFITEHQRPNGSWSFQDSLQGNPHISSELETAFILSAMIQCDDQELEPLIYKACSFLFEKQLPSGAWNGGRFPIENKEYHKYEYLLCTSLITESFSKLINE
jgi:hypothetical protein